ncbi:MATE family efflux transporter [Acidaminobacter sp. JC074]|uniref:MATE family efflux transporter n=1 Tax=Acidaminobacter sp. JC074 TaxID=2530199 RepID=UPI001F0DFC5B|nr:MATE family efflux transporter [Acidaminobacter sp. JC074]MCH4887638.1 MATE family efflux transporter [Acidaminobacter sp. JC074]
MNNQERAKLMGQEKIPKVLMKLALPAIIGMMVSAIYNLVDTLFVSMLGTIAISAVSVVYPMFMLLSAIGLMFGIGGASFVSRLLGKDNKEKAEEVATTTVLTSAGTSILVTIFLIVFLQPVLKMFGATPDIMPSALSYGRVLVFGSAFTILNMTFNNLLRAEGSAKYSMIGLSLGAVLNIILDPIFIFVFDFGVSGAAIATVISQAISTVVLISFFLRKKTVIHLSLKKFKPSTETYSELFKIGIPTFIRQFLMSFSMGLLNTAASPYGAEAIASLGIVTKVFSLVAMVIFGYAQGFQPVAGYNYGAGYTDRLKEAIRFSLIVTSIFCTVSTLVYFTFTPQIISIFSSDPKVVEISIRAMRAMVLFFPLFGFQTVYGTLFQALGKGKEAATLSLSRQGIFFIPAILILPQVFQLDGVLFAQPFADLCTILLTAVLAIRVHKEINQISPVEVAA